MSKTIQVLVVPVSQSPYLKEVANELESLQQIVGGHIEVVQTRERLNLVCNEEGKLNDLEPNISTGMDYIAGQFFVCNNDTLGDFTSITKEEAEDFLYHYVIGRKVNPINNVKGKWDL